MAGSAIVERPDRKGNPGRMGCHGKRFMAFCTCQSTVFARQGEMSFAMIERFDGSPSSRGVTGLAVRSGGLFVPVFVTACTIRAQSKKCRAGGILWQRSLFDSEPRLIMALGALKPRVFSIQVEAGLLMIERLRREARDLNIPAEMLLVAFVARACRRQGMHAVLAGNQGADLRVTAQTFRGSDFGTALVARRAIVDAFEQCVSFGKRPGRDLGPCRGGAEQEERKNANGRFQNIQVYPSQIATPTCTASVMNMIMVNGR